MNISFAKLTVPRSNVYVVGVYEGGVLSLSAQVLDTRLDGLISRSVSASLKFKGKLNQTLEIVGVAGAVVRSIILLGMGSPQKLSRLEYEEMGGKLFNAIKACQEKSIAIALDTVENAELQASNAAVAFAVGLRLASYTFDRYFSVKKKDEIKNVIEKISIQTARPREASNRFDMQNHVINGVFFTRDLVSEPPNVIYPESFVERCQELSSLGVQISVLDEEEMRKLGMNALLGVGQGSSKASRLLVMQWNGDPKRGRSGTVAVVGKGVTFDTGGISLKPAINMDEMKFDMAGAGAVAGLMMAVAGRKAKANVIGVCGLVENMPSGDAMRPGDILKSMSGQTIEVLNTDAEGRLVLADALWYTQDKFKPKYIIDLATLTGAILISLAQEYAGIFSNSDTLSRLLTASGETVGEKVWRFPLHPKYNEMIDSKVADIRNIGTSKMAGSITAAEFLQRFVNKVSWSHLDIAGAAWTNTDLPTTPKGATGWGVRLLNDFIANNIES